MYLEITNKGKKPVALLRESYREDGKVKKRTIANLTGQSLETLQAVKTALMGGTVVEFDKIPELIECQSTNPWGAREAAMTAIDRLDLPDILDPVPSEERSLVLAMIIARVIKPQSKNASATWIKASGLSSKLNLEGVSEDKLYKAMDWLLERQPHIEKELVSRHMKEGDLMFLDLSSSYCYGTMSSLISSGENGGDSKNKSELIKRGYSRDRKRGFPQINYSLLADKEGRPLSIEAYPGNTSDTTIFMPTIEKINNTFNIKHLAIVGDRGMISGKDITVLKSMPGLEWISALRSSSIKELVISEGFRFTLFDEYGIAELASPIYPNERLIVCRNPDLMAKRRKVRQSLIDVTNDGLKKVLARIEKGRLKKKEAIAAAVTRVVDKYKMNKHLILTYGENSFEYSWNLENIEKEEQLDGIYVIRTSISADYMTKEECVNQYKNLSQVEQAFRSMKSIELQIRPIFHYIDDRIRAHLLLVMLAYYVQWHMKEAWREITFSDEEIKKVQATKNPVAPYQKSEKAAQKASTKKGEDGVEVVKFSMIIEILSMASEVKLTLKQGPETTKKLDFVKFPKLNPLEKKALSLLSKIPKYPARK
jgi:transposase